MTSVLSVRSSSSSLLRRFCLEHVRIVRLTDNFWHYQLALFVGMSKCSKTFIVIEVVLLLLPEQRVVWYSLAQWQLVTTKETNHVL